METDPFSNSNAKFSLKIDSKGRILIPVEIRKTLGLFSDKDVIIELVFDKGYAKLYRNGYDGVIGNTEVCGTSKSGSNPDRSPKKRRGDEK